MNKTSISILFIALVSSSFCADLKSTNNGLATSEDLALKSVTDFILGIGICLGGQFMLLVDSLFNIHSNPSLRVIFSSRFDEDGLVVAVVAAVVSAAAVAVFAEGDDGEDDMVTKCSFVSFDVVLKVCAKEKNLNFIS